MGRMSAGRALTVFQAYAGMNLISGPPAETFDISNVICQSEQPGMNRRGNVSHAEGMDRKPHRSRKGSLQTLCKKYLNEFGA